MKVIELYRETRNKLESAGICEADAEARLIVADGLGITLGDIFIKQELETAYDPAEILRKRIAGMPLAYAMNRKYFMGFPFYVDGSVLIPRQDTETVAQEAICLINQNGYKTALDLCCGSGCIGIALSKLTGVCTLGSDISGAAVAIANKNAKLLGADGFCAVVSDLFCEIKGKFDIIVCNPPYITNSEYETLEIQVRGYEPKEALVGNLDFYKKIAAMSSGYLNTGGALVLEIGCSQKSGVEAILQKNRLKAIRCKKDLAGRDRVMVCTIN